MYDTLVLTDSFLSGDGIMWCTLKNLLSLPDDIPSLFHTMKYNSLLLCSQPCTPINSNLYFANFLPAVFSDPDLQRLHTFQVSNPTYIFPCLYRFKRPVQDNALRSRLSKHVNLPSDY